MTEKKKKKWGKIGAPDSQERADYLASIRKKKRNTKEQREAKAATESEEDITLIESPTVDLDLEETVNTPVQKQAKAAADIEVKEQKKMESPGEPGEPYVVYPY